MGASLTVVVQESGSGSDGRSPCLLGASCVSFRRDLDDAQIVKRFAQDSRCYSPPVCNSTRVKAAVAPGAVVTHRSLTSLDTVLSGGSS